MVENTKGIINLTRNMDLAYIYGQMAGSMRGSGPVGSKLYIFSFFKGRMERENIHFLKVVLSMESGKMEKGFHGSMRKNTRQYCSNEINNLYKIALYLKFVNIFYVYKHIIMFPHLFIINFQACLIFLRFHTHRY